MAHGDCEQGGSPQPAAIVTSAPDAVGLARDEILRAAPGARVLAALGEGVLLLGPQGVYPALVDAWRRQSTTRHDMVGPIFVRHLCPVQRALPLPAGDAALDALRAAAGDLSPLLAPALAFSVQARVLVTETYRSTAFPRRYDVNTALAEVLAARTGAPLDVRDPAQVLSVVVAEYLGGATGFLGVSPAADNLSGWAGGVRRFAREKGQVSRAEFKLLEALELFDVRLPAEGLALDLGAAPGGWTRVVRQRGLRVVAVDPAALSPSLASDAGVRHLRMTAEAYLTRGPERFDLILNDMRMDARDSARLMVAYGSYLAEGGQAIMTLKLPQIRRRRALDEALAILRETYRVAGARQLFHNRSEVTVYLRRR